MNNQFSENLKKIRKEHNLSQEQLADELGVSRQAISKWESSSAYPEMDKIIALCDKFNLNIDDLLHKDIKEAKGEEESKNKINNAIKDFLKFITDSVNLFINMSFKSKIKCLFEQFIIILILAFASNYILRIISGSFIRLINFLPDKIVNFFSNTLDVILTISLLIASIIILTHIFKTRYLDYYVKEEIDEPEEKKEDHKKEKIELKKENKIIIRDPKHSEYKFINTLFKLIIYVIKFFSLCFGLFVSFGLICLFIGLVISFMLYKTGLFFIGLILAILSASIIAIIVILLILNFVFNRKNDKKKMIWSFIISLIVFGIGCGLIVNGTISFDILDNSKLTLQTITKEYDMKDDTLIFPYNDYNINYVKSDNNNIKVDYMINEYCSLADNYNEEHKNILMAWTYCEDPTKLIRTFIKNANDKKIILIDDKIEKITIYTNESNINKLKNNLNNYQASIEKEQEKRNSYESRIEELEDQNSELKEEISKLKEQLDNQD